MKSNSSPYRAGRCTTSYPQGCGRTDCVSHQKYKGIHLCHNTKANLRNQGICDGHICDCIQWDLRF